MRSGSKDLSLPNASLEEPFWNFLSHLKMISVTADCLNILQITGDLHSEFLFNFAIAPEFKNLCFDALLSCFVRVTIERFSWHINFLNHFLLGVCVFWAAVLNVSRKCGHCNITQMISDDLMKPKVPKYRRQKPLFKALSCEYCSTLPKAPFSLCCNVAITTPDNDRL